ncbi:MAG: DUF3667 domain-containing protein [Pedobacter sp.]|nr:MAG: DUF3667 domain-containing protein [Pedobacter sp.]
MSSSKLRKEKDCLNCGHIVEEHFCPHCGQENIVVKEDAMHMVAHAIADYFHFENKFFGTLKPLLLKPGELTKQYVAGKRVSFIHPIRLYIFVSIVFFLFVLGGKGKEEKKQKAVETTQLSKKQQDSVALATVEKNLKYVPGGNGLRDSILKEAREEIAKDTLDDSSDDANPSKVKKLKWANGSWMKVDTTVASYEKKQAALPKNERDGFVKHYVVKRFIELNQYENPQQKFIEGLMHNVPKMMFLLLPLFALILKLVYINKDKYYYEHLIYSFHVHAALFLVILFTMLLQWVFNLFFPISGILGTICFFYTVWYIYRSLRTFYGSSRWVTILKICFLNFCYLTVFTICLLVIMAVSFAMT